MATAESTSLLERQLAASVKEVQESKMSTSIQKAEVVAPLARVQETGIGVDELVARVSKVREVQARVMKNGHHYGQVPGIEKPTLLKPGAELLGMTFQLDPQFEPVDRWDGEHLESVVKCTLYHAPTGTRLGSGIGSCSSKEKKYAWRGGGRKCPECGSATALMKSKDKPEWFCWRKKDGCGLTFPLKDERITSQNVNRTPNPDLADQYNTVRKMACKRAHVAAILFVTCASEIFTQDAEDTHESYDSPAMHPDEERHEPARKSDKYERCVAIMAAVEKSVASTNPVTWDSIVAWRGQLGARSGWPATELNKLLNELYAGDEIAVVQKKELGQTWNRVDRQVKRYEGIVPRPNADDEENQPL